MSSLSRRIGLVLFMSLFACQAGFLTLGLILPEVGREFGLTTPEVGQLRSISGIAGGVTAIVLMAAARGLGVRRLLMGGLLLMAGCSVASALAPWFAVLAVAQAGVGVATSVLLSAGIAAVAEWVEPERRARVLSWAVVGQPAAWVVGMPAIGALSDASWRFAFLLPLLAAVFAARLVWFRPADRVDEAAEPLRLRSLGREPDTLAWGIGELLAYSAWTGFLVYIGAMLLETYGASASTGGLILGVAAIAFFPSTFIAGRLVDRYLRALLIGAGLSLALVITAIGAFPDSLATSSILLCVAVFLAGARSLAGSAFGLHVSRGRAVAITSIRTAATQFGSLFGAAVGGLALAAGGYELAFEVFGVLLVLAVIPHLLLAIPARYARNRPAGVAQSVRAAES